MLESEPHEGRLNCTCSTKKFKWSKELMMPLCVKCDKPTLLYVRFCDFCEQEHVPPNPKTFFALMDKYPELDQWQRLALPVTCAKCKLEYDL